MATVTVYRVEDAHGNGPYNMDHWPMAYGREWDRFENLMRATCLGERHPPPPKDGIETHSAQYVCGFADLSALHSWFTPEDLEGMARWGYLPTEYSVDDRDILHGCHQLMFDQDHAQLVRRFQPSELAAV
jgi:hypothetical protein